MWFIHAKCDVQTHEFDFHTKSVIFTRRVWFKHAQMWFQHAEYGFHTQSVIFTHMCVILTSMSVIMTLTSMITTRTGVIYTRTSIILIRCVDDEKNKIIKLPLCIWISHSACRNHTRACWNHTLRSEIRLVLAKITLCVWTSHYIHAQKKHE
jgi:hypothetical protein